MAEQTGIAWTDHTFNPWWGCTRVSPACDHCYAETFAKRYGHDLWGIRADRRFFGSKHWNEPFRWNRQAAEAGHRALVFCASMADVFEDRRDLDPWRERLWQVIEQTPHLIWQLLTKRPENVAAMVPRDWMDVERVYALGYGDTPVAYAKHWPDNVWIGATVENQRQAELRIPHLLVLPAPVRFLSCEPLLGPVRLTDVGSVGDVLHADGINWVIVGGESGGGRRQLDHTHAQQIIDDCYAHGVPAFFKQDSGPHSGRPGPPDLEQWKRFPQEAHR